MTTARIPLRASDGSIRAWAVVDAADLDWLNQWRWCLLTKGYVGRRGSEGEGKTVRLHRQILGLVHLDGLQGDHINGDKLDNRRSNLRIVTNAQNMQNSSAHRGSSSQFRGVHFHRGRKPSHKNYWVASARIDGRLQHIGAFRTEEEAAVAAAAYRREHMPFSQEAAA